MVKPILLAVLLGVLFGAGLIYYFSDLTPDTLPAATTETDDEEPSSDEPVGEQAVSGSTLSKPASAFEVIQFGMFSNQANAEELIQKNYNLNLFQQPFKNKMVSFMSLVI
ncbi:SPOR domain-containing protein [Piscibacillus salipiscarius]|uniref:SPOR domain-containing protein n=1 Tax=Piscibacillus salipiscarius TaxID=299480 RepID=UPI0024365F4F|nr:hypothetical protein [Piscibacillus salipiscarius]